MKCVFVHVRVYVYVCVFMRECMCASVYICVCVYVYMCVLCTHVFGCYIGRLSSAHREDQDG